MMDSTAIKIMDNIAIYQLDITAHMRMMDKLLSSVNIVLQKMVIIVIQIKGKCAIIPEKIFGAIRIMIRKIVSH